MSINGNPVMIESSSGGEGNTYISLDPPTSAIGENDDYYFQLRGKEYGTNTEFTSSARSTGGYCFDVKAPSIKVSGLRAKLRSNITGIIKLGTGNNVLASVNVSYNDGDWAEVQLDSPVTLGVGRYVVIFEGEGDSMYYASGALAMNDDLTYVCGMNGAFPGTYDRYGDNYSCDIIIDYEDPKPLKKQYFKSNGVWTEVT